MGYFASQFWFPPLEKSGGLAYKKPSPPWVNHLLQRMETSFTQESAPSSPWPSSLSKMVLLYCCSVSPTCFCTFVLLEFEFATPNGEQSLQFLYQRPRMKALPRTQSLSWNSRVCSQDLLGPSSDLKPLSWTCTNIANSIAHKAVSRGHLGASECCQHRAVSVGLLAGQGDAQSAGRGGSP